MSAAIGLAMLLACVQPADAGSGLGNPAVHSSNSPVFGSWQTAGFQQGSTDGDDLMLQEPVGDLPVVDDARWSAGLTANSAIATIWWVCLLFLLLAAGLPWARVIFRESAYAAGHARLIALLISGYLVWIFASLEVIRFQAIWAALALAFVGLAGWLILRFLDRRAPPDNPTAGNALLGPEIAFWSVFALFLSFRLINPDSWHPIWGGEKPMEFAHINAILRSAHFPPFDPWFSGGILNYYYYGEYLVAYLMKLSGIPSEVAFNLAQPAIMALLASGVFSVGASLASRLSRLSSRPWIGGATAVVIVVLMGNLVALRNVLESLPSLPSPSFIDWTWAGSRAIAGGITEFPYFTGLYADLHAHVVALPVTVLVIAIGFELASRDVHTAPFSFRHACETLAAPLLLAALSLGTLGASNAWDVPLYAALIAASIFMCFQRVRPLQVAIGAFLVTSAIVFGLAYVLFKPFHDSFVALFSSVDRVRSGTSLTEFVDHLGGLLILIALGFGAYLIDRHSDPDRYVDTSRLPLVLVSVAALMGVIVAALELESHPISTASFLTASMLGVGAISAYTLTRFDLSAFSIVAIGSTAIAVFFVAWRGWDVLAVTIAIAAAGALTWMSGDQPAIRYTGLLIAAGGFAAGGVEIIYVVDDLQSLEDWYRMNTLFKVYNEVWIVFGLAASALIGAALIRLAAIPRDRTKPTASESIDTIENHSPESLAERPSPAPMILIATAAIVIAAGLLYPLLATAPRLDLRFPGHPAPTTLNALDWMRYGTIQSAAGETISFAEDREVIDWFNDEVPGSPVIAEASIGPYRGNGSRISIATGLPAVLGWDRHERQQRYPAEITMRFADLQELYNSTDPARKLQLLNKYDVEYVIVGQVERKSILPGADGPYASEAGLAAFESMVGDTLEIAFQSGETIVYRVLGTGN